nr:uncharacterized protein LOC109169177 [Ipomoea batatas]
MSPHCPATVDDQAPSPYPSSIGDLPQYSSFPAVVSTSPAATVPSIRTMAPRPSTVGQLPTSPSAVHTAATVRRNNLEHSLVKPHMKKKIFISDFTTKTGLIGKLKSCQLFTSVVTIDRFVKPVVYEFYANLAPELITSKLTGWAKTRWVAKDTIKAVGLTASFALLHKIACGNWMPTKHHAYVKRSMAVFLYKIDQGVMINLGKLLFQHILDARNGANNRKELILPNLIYGILV